VTNKGATTFQMLSGLLIAALTAWNGLYFMEQAIKMRYVNTLVSR